MKAEAQRIYPRLHTGMIVCAKLQTGSTRLHLNALPSGIGNEDVALRGVCFCMLCLLGVVLPQRRGGGQGRGGTANIRSFVTCFNVSCLILAWDAEKIHPASFDGRSLADECQDLESPIKALGLRVSRAWVWVWVRVTV